LKGLRAEKWYDIDVDKPQLPPTTFQRAAPIFGRNHRLRLLRILGISPFSRVFLWLKSCFIFIGGFRVSSTSTFKPYSKMWKLSTTLPINFVWPRGAREPRRKQGTFLRSRMRRTLSAVSLRHPSPPSPIRVHGSGRSTCHQHPTTTIKNLQPHVLVLILRFSPHSSSLSHCR